MTIAAIFVSAGPLLGYVLSRGPGLPDYDPTTTTTSAIGPNHSVS
ncbi:hypothetical protein [Mycobacterium sp.]|jgi:hypothetical protein|nr:hypothetical protein [Mycobacterium sp.]